MVHLVFEYYSNQLLAKDGKVLEALNIMDNLLTYRLAKELVTKTRVEAILLKVDFMKAYDRIEHLFIWDTM